jgi:uracil-DNA glycosylase
MNRAVENINKSWSTNPCLETLLKNTAHHSWLPFFKASSLLDKFEEVQPFLEKELDTYGSALAILPRPENVFRAFQMPFSEVKVVVIGQDVYPNIRQLKTGDEKGQYRAEAMGLAFSVPKGMRIPPSLRNVYKEVSRTEGTMHETGDLTSWAKQGVLLLNSALTVRQYAAGSHLKQWAPWTDLLISKLSEAKPELTYLLWGNFAKRKGFGIKNAKKILEAGHPSPLNRRHPFIGCGHFSEVSEIDW